LDENVLDPLCMGYTLVEIVDLHSWTSSIPITDLDRHFVDCK